jgi:hypothetical protein
MRNHLAEHAHGFGIGHVDLAEVLFLFDGRAFDAQPLGRRMGRKARDLAKAAVFA